MKKIIISLLLTFAFVANAVEFKEVKLPGKFYDHLQGFAIGNGKIYWSQTSILLRTDEKGNIERVIDAPGHHGDCCFHDGKLYVAVNLGKFNTKDKAKNEVWVYDADLNFLEIYPLPFLEGGLGGIEYYNGSFYCVGGIDASEKEFKICKVSKDFKLEKEYFIPVENTFLGVQTILRTQGRFLLGCYLKPNTTPRLFTFECDDNFNVIKRHKINTSCGMAAIQNSDGCNILVAKTGWDNKSKFAKHLSSAYPAKIELSK